MGFFAQFAAWLDSVLLGYIADTTARVAGALEPVVVAACTLYLMTWGAMQLTGKIAEPFLEGVKRIVVVGIVLTLCIQVWWYNDVVANVFFEAPGQLAAVIVGAYEPIAIIDEIFAQGTDVGETLLAKAGILNGDFSFYLAALAVYLLVALAAVYAVFLLTLSRIALSVLLALGPLFFLLALFDSTRRFLESWLAQLANYALVAVLTVLISALLLTLLGTAAREAANAGGGVQIAHVVRIGLAAGLTFLCLRQVMSMAAGLASGIALQSYGVMSAAVAWGLGRTLRGAMQFGRGATLDRDTTRWDPLSRKAGYYTGAKVRAGWQRLRDGPNAVRPS